MEDHSSGGGQQLLPSSCISWKRNLYCKDSTISVSYTHLISDTHYCLGSVMGPHPFPTIVRDFQAVISKEIKDQMFVKEGRLPDAVIACVGGGSNAIGSFYHFIEDENVRLIGCEAAGRGIDTAAVSYTHLDVYKRQTCGHTSVAGDMLVSC